MSEQTPGGAPDADRPGDDYPEALAEEFGDDEPNRSRWPFLAALGVVVIAVAIVVGVALISPPSERLNDSTLVQYAVNDVYAARNSLNYEQYRNAHCARVADAADFPTTEQFIAENRKARDAQGPIVIPSMDVNVYGDTANVTVHWHRERTENQTQTTETFLVRDDDKWKVCTQ